MTREQLKRAVGEAVQVWLDGVMNHPEQIMDAGPASYTVHISWEGTEDRESESEPEVHLFSAQSEHLVRSDI